LNASIFSKPIYGNSLEEGRPLAVQQHDKVVISGQFKDSSTRLGLSSEIFSRNILCTGGGGSGKTNAISSIVHQIKTNMQHNDVMVIFDTKGDYFHEFYDRQTDAIIGSSPQYQTISEKWNVFHEITADGDQEQQVILNSNELAASLFERNKSAHQPFFANAARSIFSAYLLAVWRESMLDGEFRKNYMHNEKLYNYFNTSGIENYFALADSGSDMASIRTYLGDGSSEQAMGVLSELLIVIRDIFVSAFGRKGDFSIRRFVNEKRGRTLFIEYDLSIGETLVPIYSLLIDLVIKESLSQGSSGNTYIILDEFKLVPYMKHIDDAVNFGRSFGLKIIAGLQNVSQLYQNYGEHKSRAILSGFGSMFAFRPNDNITRDFIREYFGRNISYEMIQTSEMVKERRNGHTAEEWEINSLRKGEAIIGLGSTPPFRFLFDLF